MDKAEEDDLKSWGAKDLYGILVNKERKISDYALMDFSQDFKEEEYMVIGKRFDIHWSVPLKRRPRAFCSAVPPRHLSAALKRFLL